MQLALIALSQARVHPGLATTLARSPEAARRYLAGHKRTLLAIFHTDDARSAVLQADYGEVSAALDLLEDLSDEELVVALQTYGSMFLDQTAAVLDLRQRLTQQIVPLQERNEQLEAELAKYKENEGWLVEQAIKAAQSELPLFIQGLASIPFRPAPTLDLEEDHPVTAVINLNDLSLGEVVSEVTPLLNEGTADELRDQAFPNDPGSLKTLLPQLFRVESLTVDAHGVVQNVRHMPAEDQLSGRPLTQLVEEAEACLRGKLEGLPSAKVAIGIPLGFLNVVETEDTEVRPHYLNELERADPGLVMRMSLREVTETVLPYLHANGVVRKMIDPSTETALLYRIRHGDPAQTDYSYATYLVTLQTPDGVDQGNWQVCFTAITAVIKE